MNVTPGEASARDALRTDGHYMRRLIEATPIPGGIHAFVSLIAFNDEGDERHSIIRSDEPLSSQTINTLVPNRPAEKDRALPGERSFAALRMTHPDRKSTRLNSSHV